jgi:YVTN family beta-propeller protein
VAISPDGKTLFTANGSSNDVSVVDVATFKVEARIAVGDSPWGALIVPNVLGKMIAPVSGQ